MPINQVRDAHQRLSEKVYIYAINRQLDCFLQFKPLAAQFKYGEFLFQKFRIAGKREINTRSSESGKRLPRIGKHRCSIRNLNHLYNDLQAVWKQQRQGQHDPIPAFFYAKAVSPKLR